MGSHLCQRGERNVAEILTATLWPSVKIPWIFSSATSILGADLGAMFGK